MSGSIEIDTSKLDDLLQSLGDEVPNFKLKDGVIYGIFQELTQRGHPSLLPAIERRKKELPARIAKAFEDGQSLEDAMREWVEDIAEDWRRDVNVDTGRYRDSIHVEEE